MFEVRQGETVAVIGRSGGGKSMLLKLPRLQVPDSGSIRITDEEITHLGDRRLNGVRKRIGLLFRQAALYDSLSVPENVAFPLSRHSELSMEERESLGRGGNGPRVRKAASTLRGMQKRVGLVRALALDPEILLFDEPTAALDPITAVEIGNLIIELKQKHATQRLGHSRCPRSEGLYRPDGVAK